MADLENKAEVADPVISDRGDNPASSNTKESVQQPEEPTDPITVPRELVTRHPLQCRWALWYLKGDRNKDWEDCLKQVSLFDTVEDFWALYNHIQPASGLTWGSDYYLFKEGIKPMWEDPGNVKGGRWLVVVDKHKRNTKLDQYWLELMMAIIGEQFEEYGTYICGAVVNVRQKGDKVALWTSDSIADDVNLRIGQIIKAKLEIPDSEPIRYEVHKDSSARTSSMVKPKIVIPSTKTTAPSTPAPTTNNPPALQQAA
jgi:translation initiation factor 4E